MSNYDILQDELLKVHTTGRDDTNSNFLYFPYEPTPYKVLERLSMSGYVVKKNVLLDYGCGKGRVDFYISYQTKCHSIGIEYNQRLYDKAVQNLETSVSKNRVTFELCNAEDYIVPINVDRIFFFNPFSVDILKSSLKRLKLSLRESYREMLLFFYYPSDKYLMYLETCRDIIKIDEIDCSDIFPEDSREKIVVYKLQ